MQLQVMKLNFELMPLYSDIVSGTKTNARSLICIRTTSQNLQNVWAFWAAITNAHLLLVQNLVCSQKELQYDPHRQTEYGRDPCPSWPFASVPGNYNLSRQSSRLLLIAKVRPIENVWPKTIAPWKLVVQEKHSHNLQTSAASFVSNPVFVGSATSVSNAFFVSEQ